VEGDATIPEVDLMDLRELDDEIRGKRLEL
jgi:hypothetical protein